MKMFLTRIGFDSKAIITGDITQIDLPKSQMPGLKNALDILKKIPDIGFCFFDSRDIVRHPLVQKIVEAYGGG
jgi:phosphate starvation-inducible PhoH-like protein